MKLLLRRLREVLLYPFCRDRELRCSLRRILGYRPLDLTPYRLAFLHKSTTSNATGHGHRLSNERLEFLGDAILDAVVADIVYRHFKNKPEGFLTNTRSKIVRRETLGRVALEMGLDKLLVTALPPSPSGHPHNNYLPGNAFEALVGALYVDRGYQACLHFVERQVLGHHLDLNKTAREEQNFKSRLLEWCQKRKLDVEFQLVEERQEEGNTPVFVSSVLIEGVPTGKGHGYSKKESQQKAAKDALRKLKQRARASTPTA